LSKEHQNVTGTWSVLKDFPAPAGYSPIMEQVGTDPTKFSQFMADRAAVERLRLFFEERIGTAQGLSPLIDGIWDVLVGGERRRYVARSGFWNLYWVA
jgi:hypothetical protein